MGWRQRRKQCEMEPDTTAVDSPGSGQRPMHVLKRVERTDAPVTARSTVAAHDRAPSVAYLADCLLTVAAAEVEDLEVTKLTPRNPGQVSFVYQGYETCDDCGTPIRMELPLVVDEIERPGLWKSGVQGQIGRSICRNGHLHRHDNISTLMRDRDGRLYLLPAVTLSPSGWETAARSLIGGIPRPLRPPGEILTVRVNDARIRAMTPASDASSLTLGELIAPGYRSSWGRVESLRLALPLAERAGDQFVWARVAYELGGLECALKGCRPTCGSELARAAHIFVDESEPQLAGHAYYLAVAAYECQARNHDNNPEAADDLVSLARRALGLLSRETQPEETALCRLALARLLRASTVGPDLTEAADVLTATLSAPEHLSREILRDTYRELAAVEILASRDDSAIPHIRAAARLSLPEELESWLEEQLDAVSPERHPPLWSVMAYLLAAGRVNKRIGGRIENVESAISLAEKVMSFAAALDPKLRGDASGLLGHAYRVRISGDKTWNDRQALHYNTMALSLTDRSADPKEWALVQFEIGQTWLAMAEYEGAESRQRAIDALELASSVAADLPSARNLADLPVNLATAYLLRQGRGDTDRVMSCLAPVLDPGYQNISPERLAVAYYTRALAYILRAEEGDARRAISDLQNAIMARTAPSQDVPEFLIPGILAPGTGINRQYVSRDVAVYQGALGDAWRSLADGGAEDAVSHAYEAYLEALTFFTPERYPEASWTISSKLAEMLIGAGRWNSAHDVIKSALGGWDSLYAVATTDRTKQVLSTTAVRLFAMMANICLRLSPPRPAEALAWAEQRRSRLLRDQLTTLAVPVPLALAGDQRLVTEGELLRRLSELRGSQEDPTDEMVRRTEQVQADLRRIWDDIGTSLVGSAYVALRRGEKFELGNVLIWLRDQSSRPALVEFFELKDRLVAFVVPAARDKHERGAGPGGEPRRHPGCRGRHPHRLRARGPSLRPRLATRGDLEHAGAPPHRARAAASGRCRSDRHSPPRPLAQRASSRRAGRGQKSARSRPRYLRAERDGGATHQGGRETSSRLRLGGGKPDRGPCACAGGSSRRGGAPVHHAAHGKQRHPRRRACRSGRRHRRALRLPRRVRRRRSVRFRPGSRGRRALIPRAGPHSPRDLLAGVERL